MKPRRSPNVLEWPLAARLLPGFIIVKADAEAPARECALSIHCRGAEGLVRSCGGGERYVIRENGHPEN